MDLHGSLAGMVNNSDGFSIPLDSDGSLEWAILMGSSSGSLARVMGHPKQAEWKSVAHVCSKVARALEKIFAMFAGSNYVMGFI